MWIHVIRWIHVIKWIHIFRYNHVVRWVHIFRWIHVIRWTHIFRWIHVVRWIHVIRWTHVVKWIPLSFCKSNSWVKIFDLKSGSVYARKYSAPNQARSDVTWPVISLVPFSKETLIQLNYFRPSLINLSGMPSAPNDVHQVYQLNWGVFCTLTRSDIITICSFLSCKMRWSDHVSTTSSCWKSIAVNDYYNSEVRSSRRADWGLV